MKVCVVDMGIEHLVQAAQIETLSFSLPWSERSLASSIKDKDSLMLCALDQCGRVIGWAGAQIICGEGSVFNVCVHPDLRRMGTGHALVSELIRRAGERGAKTMTLEVRASNLAAITLYEKMGFLHLGVRREFYEKPCEDALIMAFLYQEHGTQARSENEETQSI